MEYTTITRRKVTYCIIFSFLLLVAIYLGYCIGLLYGEAFDLANISELLRNALTHPLPIRITPITSKAIFSALIVWAIIFAWYLTTIGNYMHGREYGSGRLAKPKELNKKLMDWEVMNKNKILSEHVHISTDSRVTGLNNNTLTVGGSGAGKSFNLVKPNAYNCGSGSYVFCDPKGELLRDTGNYLKMNGYRIVVLNLVEMERSDGYNPFMYIRSDEDVIKLITNLIQNTTPKTASSNDPFWEKAEGMYLQAIFLYVWYEFPKQGRSPCFRGVLELMNKAKIPDAPEERSELDEIMFRLPEDHPALITYKKVQSGAADTIRSILISAQARLAYLQNEKILRILDHDDINIPFLGEGVYENPDRKVALFCVIPDNDKSYNFIVGLLYTQIFQELYRIADYKHGGCLPVPVALWMDEFANCALPDGFTEILSTCRSREISCNIIIQNLAQLKTMFKDAWESITGNCDILIYLGGNEQSTHKYISEMLGKITIDKRSSGETLGSHGNTSRNYDKLGRDMLDAAEVRKVNNKKCLIFVKGYDPVLDDKYKTLKSEGFKTAQLLGPYKRQEQALKDGRDQFYINSGGNPADSLFYQVESYLGVFKESAAYDSGMLKSEEAGNKRYSIVQCGNGYLYEDLLVFPVVSTDSTTVRTGVGRLTKYPVVGYYNQDCGVMTADADQLKEIFTENNRMSNLGNLCA